MEILTADRLTHRHIGSTVTVHSCAHGHTIHKRGVVRELIITPILVGVQVELANGTSDTYLLYPRDKVTVETLGGDEAECVPCLAETAPHTCDPS